MGGLARSGGGLRLLDGGSLPVGWGVFDGGIFLTEKFGRLNVSHYLCKLKSKISHDE